MIELVAEIEISD